MRMTSVGGQVMDEFGAMGDERGRIAGGNRKHRKGRAPCSGADDRYVHDLVSDDRACRFLGVVAQFFIDRLPPGFVDSFTTPNRIRGE